MAVAIGLISPCGIFAMCSYVLIFTHYESEMGGNLPLISSRFDDAVAPTLPVTNEKLH